jgi:hypothetical protein
MSRSNFVLGWDVGRANCRSLISAMQTLLNIINWSSTGSSQRMSSPSVVMSAVEFMNVSFAADDPMSAPPVPDMTFSFGLRNEPTREEANASVSRTWESATTAKMAADRRAQTSCETRTSKQVARTDDSRSQCVLSKGLPMKVTTSMVIYASTNDGTQLCVGR